MSNAEFNTIETKQEGVALEIILNRPEKRNALNPKMIAELKQQFKNMQAMGEIRVVVLRANGPVFCSGADLSYLNQIKNYDRQENLNDSQNLADLYQIIYEYPKPVIALVDGPALAGGCGLVSVCDYVIASNKAEFGYPEVKIGFIAAMVSSFLIRQVGERQARNLLLSGSKIDAGAAKDIGLVNKVVDRSELEVVKNDIIRVYCSNSPNAMAVTKQIFSSFTYRNIEEELHTLSELNADYRRNSDFVEGISAFLEKRKPKWNIQ